MARPQRGNDALGRRGPGKGRRHKIVHVFTEGKVTEPRYLDILKTHGVPKDPDHQVEWHVANEEDRGSHRKPLDLVALAVRLKRETAREDKRNKVAERFRTEVWCVFDRDNHDGIETAMKQAREGGVRVAYSHPCFEVWRLAHHKVVSGTFAGVCSLATERLPFRRDPQDAADIKVVLPHQILDRYETARKNALLMNAQHGDHVSWLHRDPYTDVYVLVEEGLGLRGYVSEP
ncbi:RloB domain-containing protein [Streptomyces sp. 4R-3d]|nr:RloB domain-containing protein [Streptomyces sp. 4R-3d]